MTDDLKARGVRVRKLEWHEQSRDGRGYITGQWWAEALGGAYLISVYTTADDGCLLTLGHFMRYGSVNHPTLEAARAAAQADYEARILAALEISDE